MKGCRTARARIQAALDRELPLEQPFLLDEHLGRCPACSELERRSRALEEGLERLGDLPQASVDVEAALGAVRAALERGEEREPSSAPRPARAPRERTLALACILALGIALVVRLREPHDGPEVSDVPRAPVGTAGIELLVRAALLEAFAGGAPRPQDLAHAHGRFEELTRELARAGWPIRRLVEGALESPELDLARSAARCLARGGDAGSAAPLERALRRPGLEQEALFALGSLGEGGIPVLDRALDEPALGPGALRELCRIGGPRAAEAIERRIRRASPGSTPSRAALLDALTTTGSSAVGGLLRIAGEAGEERGPILARLPLVRGAGAELARLLETRSGCPPRVLHEALVLLQPPEALSWLEQRCGEFRERPAALATLARYEGQAPFGSLLRLAQAGRLTELELEELLRALLERDARRAHDFTQELVARGDALAAGTWAELLFASEHPGAARALARLALADVLPDEERQWAALGVGELGDAGDAALLAAELCGPLGESPRLAAACLVSIQRALGQGGVERALACAPEVDVARVLRAIEAGERAAPAVLVHRIARALEGARAALAAQASGKETP